MTQITIQSNEYDITADTLRLDVITDDKTVYDVMLRFSECDASIQNMTRLNDDSEMNTLTPHDAMILAHVMRLFHDAYMSHDAGASPGEVFVDPETFDIA